MSQTTGSESNLKISHETRERLETRALVEGDKTYDDTIARLLDQTQKPVSLSEFVNRILDSMSVEQIALYNDSIFKNYPELSFHVQTSDHPGHLLDDINSIEVAGENHLYSVEFTEYGLQPLGKLTLFASDSVVGVDPVPTSEGIPRARKWIAKHHTSDPSDHVGLRILLND